MRSSLDGSTCVFSRQSNFSPSQAVIVACGQEISTLVILSGLRNSDSALAEAEGVNVRTVVGTTGEDINPLDNGALLEDAAVAVMAVAAPAVWSG